MRESKPYLYHASENVAKILTQQHNKEIEPFDGWRSKLALQTSEEKQALNQEMRLEEEKAIDPQMNVPISGKAFKKKARAKNKANLDQAYMGARKKSN